MLMFSYNKKIDFVILLFICIFGMLLNKINYSFHLILGLNLSAFKFIRVHFSAYIYVPQYIGKM